MAININRREFVGRIAGTALALPLLPQTGSVSPYTAPADAEKGFHGIFAILETPFTQSNAIDEEDLAREVDFCLRCGAHGLVWPQLAAEFFLLSEEERMRGAEVIIRTAARRRPVVIGVQEPYKGIAVNLARHAENKGADAIIAIPPFVGGAGLEIAADYYRSLAQAVRLPIFVQNSGSPWGPGMSTEFIIQQAREFPQLAYIKEEVSPVPHRLEAYVKSGAMKGIFSGSAGMNLLNEMSRGSSGTMPACSFIDINAQIYDLGAVGKAKEAYELFAKLLPMINLEHTYGMVFAKSVLVRRGVFKTARMRHSTGLKLDHYDEKELDFWWRRLQPYFRAYRRCTLQADLRAAVRTSRSRLPTMRSSPR
ncbi:MAG: dihydrodipicolinate synthase family protein [Acidobacteria bacterium]|nr:MAG: dihydrodipicolinate synthase family protein [Acidobacteriota bacterium]